MSTLIDVVAVLFSLVSHFISNLFCRLSSRKAKILKKLDLKIDWGTIKDLDFYLFNQIEHKTNTSYPSVFWRADAIVIDKYGDFYLVKNIWRHDLLLHITTKRRSNIGFIPAKPLKLEEARTLIKKDLVFKNFK